MAEFKDLTAPSVVKKRNSWNSETLRVKVWWNDFGSRGWQYLLELHEYTSSDPAFLLWGASKKNVCSRTSQELSIITPMATLFCERPKLAKNRQLSLAVYSYNGALNGNENICTATSNSMDNLPNVKFCERSQT